MEAAVDAALALAPDADADDAADAEAEATLRRHLLPRVREALLQERPAGLVTASTLLQPGAGGGGLAGALEAAREEMAAVGERCVLAQKTAAAEAAAAAGFPGAQDQEEQEGAGNDDGETWLEEDEGSRAVSHKGGQGFVSLFALYDMPDVVLVDMGAVAERLAQARANGDVEGQLEGLSQLLGVSRLDALCCGGVCLEPALILFCNPPDHLDGADVQRALARGLCCGGGARGLAGWARLAEGECVLFLILIL